MTVQSRDSAGIALIPFVIAGGILMATPAEKYWWLPQATHTGELTIIDAVIPCAVLEDGTRLLTQAGFLSALGRSPKPKGRPQTVADGLPPFLNTKSLKDLITQEIIETTAPIFFRTKSGAKAHGYKAELLPKVCNGVAHGHGDGCASGRGDDHRGDRPASGNEGEGFKHGRLSLG